MEPYASVLIPTFRPGAAIQAVLRAVFAQCPGFDFEVVIVDSGSSKAELAAMRSFPVRLHQIPSSEFGHGRTRNVLAQLAHGRVLMYLSQDAEPTSGDWMAQLAGQLSEPSVAGAYARQVPRPGADPLIRFFLAEMYGSAPARRRLPTGRSARLQDIFFSNVSSAVRRDVWERFPFRGDILMSEDQYWAWDVLRAGYQVVYAPTACVFHSHNYSVRTMYKRNWLSGASLRGLIADTPSAVVRRGVGYVKDEALFLLRQRRAAWLPYMLFYEASKALGFAMGSAGWQWQSGAGLVRTARKPRS